MNNLPLIVAWHNLNQQQIKLIRGQRSTPPDEDPEPQWNGHCFWEILGLILVISFIYMMT